MLSNKNKRGAMALFIVFLLPIILMVFSIMLDGVLIMNTKNATQRYLDITSLSVVNFARTNGCIITDEFTTKGVDLFNQNIQTASGLNIEYTLIPMRNAGKDAIGISSFVLKGKVVNTVGQLFIPFAYNYHFTLETIAVCDIEYLP